MPDRVEVGEGFAEWKAPVPGTPEQGQTETVESKAERKKLEDLNFIHVDDQDSILESIGKELSGHGIKNELGKATSSEAAIALIKGLLRERKKLDIIISDRDFFAYDGDEIEQGGAAENVFLPALQELMKSEEFKDALQNVKVVMNSAMEADDFENIKEKFPELVVGWIRKGVDTDTTSRLREILETANVIEKG